MGVNVKKIVKMLRQLWLYLLRIRGTTLEDELRLIVAVILYILDLGRGSSVGFYIPGTKYLTIRTWDGCTFIVRPKTTELSLATLTAEFYELTRWFIPNAKGIVIDIGANIGGYTIRACKQADLVIAIEPQKEVFELLKVNVRINCNKHNVILIKKAVGDRRGKALLRIPGNERVIDSGSASLLSSDTCKDHECKYEEVEMDTLDNIIEALGIDKVDFIKIDIEGAEAIAFKGMRRTLEKAKYVMIEIQPDNEWLIDEFRNMGFILIDKKGMNYFFTKAR